MMDVGKINFTSSASRSLDQLKDFADQEGHSLGNSMHMFYLCFKNSSGCFESFLKSRGILLTQKKIISVIDKIAKENPSAFISNNLKSFEVSKDLGILLIASHKISEKYEHAYVGTEHIIYSFLESHPRFCDLLLERDIDTEHLKLSVLAFIAGENPNTMFGDEDFILDDEDEDDEDEERSSISSINKYCSLLNEQVKLPSFSKISGRENEIGLMQEVLCRKLKSNCVLIGEAGTGKTTIVEGLAQLIEDPDYNGPLKNKNIYSLDVAALVAGTKYRGQFEARLNQLLSELKKEKDCILFIDEIHTIVGAGSKEGAQDFANIIKPSLARGEIKCIGATTSSEYKKHFEKDAALARRFHAVHVDEPDAKDTLLMIQGSLPSYELHHSIKFSNELGELAVKLCEIYLPNQRFPDKAFDVIDLASSKARIRSKRKNTKVSANDIYAVIAEKINVDIETIKESSSKKFSSFEQSINQCVYGQEENISKIYDLLACAKVGLQSSARPIASFFFVGPTSVGKTFTAKKIAKEFYGNEKSFLQINMSEYQEQSSISRLIGASAGYVGFEEGGLLTEFVRKNPNSLILFDEAEKCNPNVLNLLLQILDEASLKDNLNRSIDFSRCIIVMTSNVGSNSVQSKQLGFAPEQIDKQDAYQASVKSYLAPELASRIDEVVVFNSLSSASVSKIFGFKLNEIKESMKKNGVDLQMSIEASDFIDFKNEDHARDIKKIVRKNIEIPIAKFLIQNPNAKRVSAKMIDNKLNIC
jgi:ATP-dependent Clp protease ATP-binding subunit ClpA